MILSIWKDQKAWEAHGKGAGSMEMREKVAAMHWADIALETGVWTIPNGPREKDNAGGAGVAGDGARRALRVARRLG